MRKLIVAVVVGLGVVVGLPVEAQAQATAKPQFIWNQQEREAVDAVKAWVNAWSTKDPQRVAELMADNSVFRADPAEPMKTGREAFVALITPLMPRVDSMTIDEIYVTGTEWDSAVMIKRSDKMSATAGAALAGRTVTVAAFFRAKNRKITEWLDAPVAAPALDHQSAAQATGKPPASYTPQERAAVAVVQGWIEAWKAHDIDKLMSYMADNLVFRADVSEELQHGRDGFERIARGVMNGWCGMDLEEVFVVGGDTDTVVLAKRIDYFPGNPPRGRGPGGLTGMAIPVAIMFRVKNGKISEWLDAPLIPVGPGAPPMPGARGRGGPPPGAGPGGPGRGAAPPITPPTPCIGV